MLDACALVAFGLQLPLAGLPHVYSFHYLCNNRLANFSPANCLVSKIHGEIPREMQVSQSVSQFTSMPAT